MNGEHRGVDLGHPVDITAMVSNISFSWDAPEGLIERAYNTRQSYHMEARFIPPRTELERRQYARTMAWMTLTPVKQRPLIHNGKKPRK